MARKNLASSLRELLAGPWSVRLIISVLSIKTLSLLAAGLILLSWNASKHNLLEAAHSSATKNSEIIALQVRRNIDTAGTLLRVLAASPVQAGTRQQRLARLPALLGELDGNPLLSALYVGHDNGEFILIRTLRQQQVRQHMRAPDNASYMVQLIEHDRTTSGSYLFFDRAMQLVEERSMPDYRYDPRQRDWYRQAVQEQQLVPTAPYVFYSTGQTGITLSVLADGGKAVYGLDLALDELSLNLQSLAVTPGTELAIIDRSGTLIAYRDPAQVLGTDTNGQPRTRTLRELGSAPLTQLYDQYQPDSKWLGQSYVLNEQLHLYLLISTPLRKVLASAYENRNRQLLLAVGLSLLFFLLSFSISNVISRRLQRLLKQVRRITRFDFSHHGSGHSLVKESNHLHEITDQVSQTMHYFLEISQIISTERDTRSMLQQVLERCVLATGSSAGVVYLLDDNLPAGMLNRRACHGPLPVIAEQIPYPAQHNFWGLNAAADTQGQSQFTFELRDRQGELNGLVALLRNTLDEDDPQALQFQTFVERLSGLLAVTIETHALIDSQERLLNGFIRMLADAIDAKSPYTSGHCQRVPTLALMLADRLNNEHQGAYAGFTLNTQQRHAFYLAAWLHDCGKLVTPDHLIDKATKLEANYNRIHEIRTRFELLWRDAELNCLKAIADGQSGEHARAHCHQRQQQLLDDFDFVACCNLGSESLSEEDQARLAAIGSQRWLRHFDDLAGLARDERELRAAWRSSDNSNQLPCEETLLQDLPFHLLDWGERVPAVQPGSPANTLGLNMELPPNRLNLGELYNLSVQRGTLTREDRFIVNNHIVQTLTMLSDLPWPKGLEEVPAIASNHHERMDGTGYPRKLKAGELPLTHRIMALADVFEALTARDRPYKEGKTLDETFDIMLSMCRNGHLDAQLFHYFLQSGIWKDYAVRFMDVSQNRTPSLEPLLLRLQPLL